MTAAGEIVYQTLVSVSPIFRVRTTQSVIDDSVVESVLPESGV
jgi:hypothetical protein